jgi:hypothetical protein
MAHRAWTWRPYSTWGQCVSSSVGCGDCAVCTLLATEQLDSLLRTVKHGLIVRIVMAYGSSLISAVYVIDFRTATIGVDFV